MMNVRSALKISIVSWLSATFLIPLTPGPFATASIYIYVDDAGVQNFTNQFDSIPEKYRSRLATSEIDSAPQTSTIIPAVPPASVSHPATDRSASSAENRKVTAHGEYRLGEHDTRTDGVRLAVEAAKKDALEQVATYLESVTEVRDMNVTRDDIRSYTAGIVKVLDEKITTRVEHNNIVIRADLTAEVDPHEVAQAIASLRENESAVHELMALRAETDRLQEQVDAANRALAAAPSAEEVQELSRQRDEMLNELQANALISQAWTSWTYPTVAYSYPWIGGVSINGLLFQAQRLSPRHRHLPLAQQTLTAQAAGVPGPHPADSSPMPHSLLVPSSPHRHAHHAAPLLNAQGQPAKVGDVVVLPTPRSAPPAGRQSVPASPQTYQLHPSHFWRPTSPNIPNAPPVPGSMSSAPRNSAGSGHVSPGGHVGGSHFGGGHQSGGGHSGGGHSGR